MLKKFVSFFGAQICITFCKRAHLLSAESNKVSSLCQSVSFKVFSFLLRLKLCKVLCAISRVPHVLHDNFYWINNICRGVLTKNWTFLNFLQTYVIASLLGTNFFVSTLYSLILSSPHNLSPLWCSLIFQITYSKAKLKNNKSK